MISPRISDPDFQESAVITGVLDKTPAPIQAPAK